MHAVQAGRTALHLAVAEGYTSVVKDLLRKGADPLTRDQASNSRAGTDGKAHAAVRYVTTPDMYSV